MAGIVDVPKPRINCSMLSQYISTPICFVGRVEKVHPTGKTFTVSDGEGKIATVELNEPLEEELSGIVEVIGMVSNKGGIMATIYNVLREDKGILFDLELYNEALKVIHDFPQHYPFQVASSG
ncbi:replication protein A 14 kDa subunit [Xiphias gladius]|uniref:replication protein A 14 kDa subunit n=1 Tax=Xiphias gladius TaxID=8245 RepID=UPI001A980F85|nr:replication protein A 14 kDa subunit [Xiphias gladius]